MPYYGRHFPFLRPCAYLNILSMLRANTRHLRLGVPKDQHSRNIRPNPRFPDATSSLSLELNVTKSNSSKCSKITELAACKRSSPAPPEISTRIFQTAIG